MNQMQINSKKENMDALNNMLLGNQIPSWKSKDELAKSGYCRDVAIRSLNPGGQLEYPVAVKDAVLSSREGIYFTGSFPDSYRTIQGELQQTEFGIYMFYSYSQKVMRVALQDDPNHATGITALSLMKQFMSPASFDDIQDLLDLYPGHVIEFTCCSRDVGDCRGRNTLIWEVRNY